MSELLDALIRERKSLAIEYKKYLEKIVALTRQIKNPTTGKCYPETLDTPAKRALYDNLDENETLAQEINQGVCESMQDEWQYNPFKTKKVRFAIRDVLKDEERTTAILELVKKQPR